MLRKKKRHELALAQSFMAIAGFGRKTFIHTDLDAQKQIDKIQKDFQEYQLALYIHGFSSFLEVMLPGNFAVEYLKGISDKIEGYSIQYLELYTKCYEQLEDYFR